MATNVGSLTVLLGLDASEYVRGLTRAERQAQQFAKNTRAAILEVGKILGGLEIGRQVFNATKDIIAEAAALNDLSDATGSSVEALSRLNNQAKIAGADFATLQNAVLKLSAGMAGVDDDSNKVQQALKILGVTTKDPVQALQDVAVKLNTYADGVNKVGLAQALFGKQGPAFLATLKDIAELQDVGATVSAKQAAEAEALEKAFRRLSAEATTFKNAVLSEIVPSLLHMIEDMKEGTRIAGGFLNAIALFGTLNPFDSTAEGIKKVRQEIERLNSERTEGGLFSGLNNAKVDRDLANAEKQLEFLKLKQRQEALRLIDPSNNDLRDILAQRKPQAPNPPGSSTSAKALKEVTSEAQRYLEALEKQLERTQELTVTEQFLRDVQLDRIKGLTPALTDQILRVTQEIDAMKALEKELEDSKKAWDEETKAVLESVKAHQRTVERALDEADNIRENNDALRDEIAIILGGENARKALEKERVANAIAIKEEALAMAQLDPLREDEAEALQIQIDLLKERKELLEGRDFAETLRAEAEALQQVKNLFSDALVDPLTDFVTGTKSAKDAFRSFVDDLTRQLARIASQNLANALFGGVNQSGPDVFGLLAKLLGSFGGGSNFLSGITDITPGAGFGIGANAAGTSYWRGGRTWVGEDGPELLDLPSGTRIRPNTQSSMGPAIGTLNVNVPTNANTRAIRQSVIQGIDTALEYGRRR